MIVTLKALAPYLNQHADGKFWVEWSRLATQAASLFRGEYRQIRYIYMHLDPMYVGYFVWHNRQYLRPDVEVALQPFYPPEGHRGLRVLGYHVKRHWPNIEDFSDMFQTDPLEKSHDGRS